MMNIKLIASVGALVAAFIAGASIAHTYDSLKYTREKNAELQALIDQHRKEKDDWTETNRRLTADIDSTRAMYADRLREFEQWKLLHGGGDAEACQSERVVALAVRGEELLRRADAYLEALMR